MIKGLQSMSDLFSKIDLEKGSLGGRPVENRYLSNLRGFFANEDAYQSCLEQDNALLYSVSSMTPAEGEGQLHLGLGVLYPGKVGDEYYMTKGHLHTKREAAEVYVGLKGVGYMLLEHEVSQESMLVSLAEGEVVYVPGYTAHRTINTGDMPLAYLGIYPWDAGHDYGAIAERNFLKVLVEREGQPVLLDRQ